jgi:hypothetical protein
MKQVARVLNFVHNLQKDALYTNVQSVLYKYKLYKLL